MAMSADQQRVELLIHLFHGRFKDNNNLSDRQLVDTIPTFFVNWLLHHYELLPKEELAAEAGVPPETWEWFEMITQGRVAIEALVYLWPAVVTSRRPQPQHPVESAAVVLIVRYADGRIFPMTSICPKEALTIEGPAKDSDVAYYLTEKTRDSIDEIRRTSLDQMYERGAPFESEENFNMFMGLVLKVCREQVQPQLQPGIMSYIRLMQGIVCPKLSDADRRRIEALRAREQGKVVGGFDLS